METLPPLPDGVFDGTFAWLPPQPTGEVMDSVDVAGALESLGADLPASFVTFMSRPELHSAVPSCTACWWDVSKARIPSPVEPGADLVRFLNDQQGCLYWYLHLLPNGRHSVVSGGIRYDDEPVGERQALNDLVEVAPDIEHFLYRFWVENTAWFEVVDEERDWSDLSAPCGATSRTTAHDPTSRVLHASQGRVHATPLIGPIAYQDAADVLGTDLGRAVIANSAPPRWLMRQAPQAIDAIADAFQLTDAERHLLLSARRGEALLVAGSHRSGSSQVWRIPDGTPDWVGR